MTHLLPSRIARPVPFEQLSRAMRDSFSHEGRARVIAGYKGVEIATIPIGGLTLEYCQDVRFWSLRRRTSRQSENGHRRSEHDFR